MQMSRILLLVRTPEAAAKAVESFAAAVAGSPDLQERLPYARAWYARPAARGRWHFAPSKWAGCHAMTPQAYLDNAATAMDGRKTEQRLRQWFTPVNPQSERYAELYEGLSEFLGRYGKQPSAACRISIIDEPPAGTAASDDDIVELIVRLVRRLDDRQQARIRQALRA
jgi:hypothetical protein